MESAFETHTRRMMRERYTDTELARAASSDQPSIVRRLAREEQQRRQRVRATGGRP